MDRFNLPILVVVAPALPKHITMTFSLHSEDKDENSENSGFAEFAELHFFLQRLSLPHNTEEG